NWRSEDTFTTIQVNFHTRGEPSDSRVYYDVEPRNGDPAAYSFQAKGHFHFWEGADRAVHHVELTELTPGKTYYFIAGDPKSGYTSERKFKTLSPQAPTLRIVTGGDMGTGSQFETITRLAGQTNPDVVL